MILIGSALIGIARRNGDAVDADFAYVVEETGYPLGLGCVEQGSIDVDTKTARFRPLDRGDGTIVDPSQAYRTVVVLAVAVEMHGPGEIGMWRELVELFFEQQRVGAQVDEFLALDDVSGDLADVAMQQRLTAGQNHDWGAAFIDRFQTFGNAQALIENRIGIVDFAAAGAGEVAPEQRFEHQH